jgi:hypothetical protein
MATLRARSRVIQAYLEIDTGEQNSDFREVVHFHPNRGVFCFEMRKSSKKLPVWFWARNYKPKILLDVEGDNKLVRRIFSISCRDFAKIAIRSHLRQKSFSRVVLSHFQTFFPFICRSFPISVDRSKTRKNIKNTARCHQSVISEF